MIEILGMACRYPGGVGSAAEFWQRLNGSESLIGEIPPGRWDPADYRSATAKAGRSVTFRAGWLESVDRFDAAYFRLSPKEATEMDPQQRLVLEVAHEALHDANINPREIAGQRVGVYVGAGNAEFQGLTLGDPAGLTAHSMSGHSLAVIANRLSYVLDITGPSLTVDTACSAALTALHLAHQSLTLGDCDLAIVAGVNVLLGPSPFVGFSQAHMLSPRGIASPFDADADGFVRAEGCGVVILGHAERPWRRLRRAYAEIVACEVNEDGRTPSLTIPNGERQVGLMRGTLARAGVRPESIVYVEAHGTGTPVGDPIEAGALSAALVGERKTALPIGSVKGHTGHLETGAGIVGLMKAALCLYHGQLVPTVGHRRWPAQIDAGSLRLRIPTAPEPLPKSELGDEPVIGVCAYGFGGANAFALLRAAGTIADRIEGEPASASRAYALPLSAHHPAALEALERRVASFAEDDRLEAARWAGVVLPAQPLRRTRLSTAGDPFGDDAVVVEGEVRGEAPRLIFAYGGQGSQLPAMGIALYERFPAFRAAIDRADTLLARLSGHSLIERYGFCRRVMDGADLAEVTVALPCIILMQVGLTELLVTAGVQPAAVFGHSTGEMTAAWACGAIDLEMLCRLTLARATAQGHMRAGAMAAWSGGRDDAESLLRELGLRDRLVVAAVNAERAVTLAGDPDAIDRFVMQSEERGIRAVRLAVPRAYHSAHVDDVLDELQTALGDIRSGAARIPFISSVAGVSGPVPGQVLDGAYWLQNIRRRVEFDRAARMAAEYGETFVEISPSAVLAGYLQEVEGRSVVAMQSQRHSGDVALLRGLAELYVQGVDVCWEPLQPPERFVTIGHPPWDHGTAYRSSSWKAPRALNDDGASPDGHLELTENEHAFLREHRVERQIVLPGAGFVALTVARTQRALREIQFRRFIQLWGGGQAAALKGERNGDCWTWRSDAGVHFACRLAADVAPPIDEETLASARARCASTVDVQRFYRAMHLYGGQDFGSIFQAVAELALGDAEAVGVVRVAAEVEPLWGRNAVLLEGSFQVLAMVAGLDSRAIVPTRIEAVDCLLAGSRPVTVVAHARLTAVGADWVEGDVDVFDEARPAWRIRGLRMERIASARAASPESFRVEFLPRGVPAEVLEWDWSDPGPHLPRLVERKRCLRVLDFSRGLVSLAALSTMGAERLAEQSPLIVAAARLPADAPPCFHAFDEDDPPDRLSFDVVIGASPTGWMAPGGLCIRIDDDSLQAQRELASGGDVEAVRAWLIGPALEAWPVGALADGLEDATVVVDTRNSLLEASALVARLAAMERPPAVLFVIRDDDNAPSPLWGFVRMARNEQSRLALRAAGLPREMPEVEANLRLLQLCEEGAGEAELRWNSGGWHVPRLVHCVVPDAPPTGEYRLEPASGGLGATFRWRNVDPARETLRPNEVRLHVRYVSLHFKDVMLALGMLRGFDPALGMECCGTILELGDDVARHHPDLKIGQIVLALTFATGPSAMRQALFGTVAIVEADRVFSKPDGIDDAAACGFLGVYSTAWYALEHVARLDAGERVLIHSAAGGVGHAAVQIALERGADVIASAGTEAKRAYLNERFGLTKLFDSRNPQGFAEAVRRLTDGRGVDVVLNSLSGPALHESLRTLAPGGRHIELGKRDIQDDAELGLLLLRNNLSFHSVQLDLLGGSHPERTRALLVESLARLRRGDARPIDYRLLPVERTGEAFRLMRAGEHVGKLVIEIPDGFVPAADQDLALEPTPRLLFGEDETLFVTGGTGGLGLALARFLAARGAGRILLLGRRGIATRRAELTVESIRRDHPQCRIEEVALDLRDLGALRALFEREQGITGVFHLAASFAAEDATGIDVRALEACAVKLDAAVELDRLTRGRALRHFVLISSLAGLYGNTGQAVYAAANSGLHELARARRRAGFRALAIDYPILLGVGRLSEPQHVRELLFNAEKGFATISHAELEPVLERLLAVPDAVPPVVSLDIPLWRGYWSLSRQRPLFEHLVPRAALTESSTAQEAAIESTAEEIEAEVRSFVARLLGAKPDEIEPLRLLADLGLDSLASIELVHWIAQRYGVEISQIRLLSGATTRAVVDAILAREGAVTAVAAPPSHVRSIVPKASLVQEPPVAPEPPVTRSVPEVTEVLPPVLAFAERAHNLEPGHRVVSVDATLDSISVERLIDALNDVRGVVVLRGRPGGEHFCLGMDLQQSGFSDAAFGAGLDRFATLARLLEAASMPVIAVVEGACRGGGMLFPSIATVVLATEEASFGFPEIRRGGLPGVVSVAAQRRMKTADCRRLMMTGDSFGALAARELGLVDFVGSSAEVKAELERLLHRFAAIDPALLVECATQLPAATAEQALITMGGLIESGPAPGNDGEPHVTLRYDAAAGVVGIELNDPLHSNAFDQRLGADLRRAIETAKGLPDVRAVVFEGSGEHFCTGINPYVFARDAREVPVHSAAAQIYAMFSSVVGIRELQAPIIAVLQGNVVGGGLATALNADYRIAASSTEISYGILARGLSPGVLISETLERIVGRRWANELYLHGYTLQASEALAIGLVNEVHPDRAAARAAAWTLARKIAANPALGIRLTTALMRAPVDRSRLARESLAVARCLVEGDAFPPGWRAAERPFPLHVLSTNGANGAHRRASDVGILAAELYFPNQTVSQADLETHLGCHGKFTVGLGQKAITFCGEDEDAVSMALTVVQRLMERCGIEWERIGRLEVGTESAVDRSKSIKTYLMQLFEAKGCADLEGVDSYNACYGGTAALFNTVAWCQSEAWDGRYGLVVCVDIADLNEEQAFLDGAAAVALLIGPDAALVMEPERATHMIHAWDFYKPLGWGDPFPLMRDGKHSVEVYIACLDACRDALSARLGGHGLLNEADYFIFHCTSAYLARRGFERLIEREASALPLSEKHRLYDQKTHPGTLLTREIGSTYCASVYVGLYSLLLQIGERLAGKTICLYSYGSGASASLYRLRVARLPDIDRSIDGRLAARHRRKPAEFLDLIRGYSAGYGRFDYRPAHRADREPGVFYLDSVDEWGRRFYHRHLPVAEQGAQAQYHVGPLSGVEVAEAQAFLYQVYCEQVGYAPVPGNPTGQRIETGADGQRRLVDRFDETSQWIGARYEGRLIGCLRISAREGGEFDLEQYIALPEEFHGRRGVEMARLAIDREHHGSDALLLLVQQAYPLVAASGHDYMLSTATFPDPGEMYLRLGFRKHARPPFTYHPSDPTPCNLLYFEIGGPGFQEYADKWTGFQVNTLPN